MAHFIDIDDGFVNLDHVLKVDFIERDGRERACYHLVNGSIVTGMRPAESMFEGECVPAPLGYEGLWFYPGEPGYPEAVTREPVIAFRIKEYGIHVITVDADSRGSPDLLCPDGRVFVLGERYYESVDAWSVFRREEHEKNKAAASGVVPRLNNV